MNQILNLNQVQMDSVTAFKRGGRISVTHCPWESEKSPLKGVERLSVRARVVINENGDIDITPYNEGAKCPLLRELFRTEHCKVRMSPNGRVTEQWSFSPCLSIAEICDIRQRECESILSFFRTAKNIERWGIEA